MATLGDQIPVSLTIIGPAGAPAYSITRAITKRAAYKNWRLNGEFIHDPEGEAGRFNVLKPGDIALMSFAGDPGPQKLTLLLVAADSPADAPLVEAFGPMVPAGQRAMVETARLGLVKALETVSAPSNHPIWTVIVDSEFEAALEDAVQGGIVGTKALSAKPTKSVSASALQAAKATAEKNGRDGEALAWVHLQNLKAGGKWQAIEWCSKINATSPFDFQATSPSGEVAHIDAKSTDGEFGRIIHMSLAELLSASDGSRYDLWRIYAMDKDGASLRIAENVGGVVAPIVNALALPDGVTIDSVSIAPAVFEWGAESSIERPDDDPNVD